MKTVLITGASTGIGRACAEYFISKGYYVGAYDLNLDALSETAQHLKIKGECCFAACDVTQFDQVEAMIAHFSEHTKGRLDVLVNCAGVLSGGAFEALTEAKIANMIDVNCKGLSFVANCAHPMLKNTPGSSLVNICSASGLYGIPGLSVYSASKFYVRGLTEALNIEWQADDIKVCSVMPPFVKTGMLDDVPQKMLDSLGIDLEPEDIAREVFDASQSSGVHHPVSSKIKLLNSLGMRLPERARRYLVRQLTGA